MVLINVNYKKWNTISFIQRSIEFKAKEMDGKNYSLIIKNLAEEIDPAKSYMKIKTGNSYNLI